MTTLNRLLSSIRHEDMVIITDPEKWAKDWQRQIEKDRKITENRRCLFGFFSYLSTLNYDRIISVVTSYYNQSFDEINTSSRKRELVQTRQVCMYFGKLCTPLTWSAIGEPFGKDHATVLYSHRLIKNLIETSPSIRADINEIKRRL